MHLCLSESCREFLSTLLSVTREVPFPIQACCLCFSAALGIPLLPMLQRQCEPVQDPAVLLPQLAVTRHPHDTYTVLQWRPFIPVMWKHRIGWGMLTLDNYQQAH